MILTEEMQAAVSSGVVVPRWLVWISARNLTTGLVEAAGFWTGEDDRTFTVDGAARTYTGAGALIEMGDLTYESGTSIQMQSMTFSMVSAEIQAAVFQYDTRLAPVEVHLALFDPETGALIGVAPAFVGWVEEPKVQEGATAKLTLSVASSARAGTRTLASKKSPESLKKRLSTDEGRRYADIAGDVPVSWGGEDKRGFFV
jgi:hypothetical protein